MTVVKKAVFGCLKCKEHFEELVYFSINWRLLGIKNKTEMKKYLEKIRYIKCPRCGFKGERKDFKIRYIIESCLYCNKEFKSLEELEIHEKREHKEERESLG